MRECKIDLPAPVGRDVVCPECKSVGTLELRTYDFAPNVVAIFCNSGRCPYMYCDKIQGEPCTAENVLDAFRASAQYLTVDMVEKRATEAEKDTIAGVDFSAYGGEFTGVIDAGNGEFSPTFRGMSPDHVFIAPDLKIEQEEDTPSVQTFPATQIPAHLVDFAKEVAALAREHKLKDFTMEYRPNFDDRDLMSDGIKRGTVHITYRATDGRGRPCENLTIRVETSNELSVISTPESSN